MEERRRYYVVYPEYFDYRLSRRLGRKVPLELCVKKPTLDELREAAQRLKLMFIVEPDKHHPANWHEMNGRLKILKPGNVSKRRLLILLAKALRIVRRERERQVREAKRTQVERFVEKMVRGG